MLRYISLIAFLPVWLLLTTGCQQNKHQPALLVNPFIGTGGHGHTYPGATLPYGMVQLSPDTRVAGWDACSGYYYADSTLLGFSHTHLSGTGAADYGDILITPQTHVHDTLPAAFSHHNEQAHAGYYAVTLNNGIKAELTATTRSGIHRYTFPTNQGIIKIDLRHGIGPDRLTAAAWQQTADNEISGRRQSRGWAKDQVVYFTARFSGPFTVQRQDSTKAILLFEDISEPLVIKVALSGVSVDNARQNLTAEAPGWDFDDYVHQAEDTWNEALGVIEADFPRPTQDTVFYTALYHSMLAPNIFNDVNGEYRGMDKQIHRAEHNYYTVFSLWDTFRATHPLYTIINPAADIDMINTMLLMYRQSGLLPVWELAANETGTMIGYHAVPVLADAISKDLGGFDYDLALEAMQASAQQEHLGLHWYKKMGFIPAEKEHESVSKTLEYAYDDWCIAQTARLLGHDSLAAVYTERSLFYQNLYDPASGFMRPKRNGNWLQPFDPYEVSGNYTEANAWQYNLFVPHDLSRLDSLYAPHSTLANKLDSLFVAPARLTGRQQPDIAGMIGQYAHGNEPSHNFAYLYNYARQPWKTQQLVHRITQEFYSNRPDGLIGNEDCGQMSAWYVFSTLGFYPVVPGRPEYTLGTPAVARATLHLPNGNKLIIKAHNLREENYYVTKVRLNGRPLQRSYLTHREIMKGGKLEFFMSAKPDTTYGRQLQAPQSTAGHLQITPVPVIKAGEMTFLDSTRISISAILPGCRIFYSLDGSDPDSTAFPYSAPFTITTTTTVKAIAYKKGRLPSRIVQAQFIKIPYRRTITLKYPYSHLYTGNSSMALIDHIRGGQNFRDGWQGFHEVNLEAVIDLGQVRQIKAVKAGFLQDQYSWIFYPKEMIVELSLDGKHFGHRKKISNLVAPQADGLQTQELGTTYNQVTARYVKVVAINMGRCPDWHKGAGEPAWLFADEITIDTN